MASDISQHLNLTMAQVGFLNVKNIQPAALENVGETENPARTVLRVRRVPGGD